MINTFRRLLIRFGKILPFVLCFIVFISYVESLIALLAENFMIYGDYITLNTPISFALAKVFEYDMLTIFAATTLSVSIQTCVWNKIGLLYLTLQLISCKYIEAQELEPTAIYIICIANLVIAGYLTFRGLKILLSK